MLPLPTSLPDWYTVEEGKERGWTPQTTDIVEGNGNPEVINAWNGTYYPQNSNDSTVRINRLQVISPIQVGGGSLPEGGTLPAQVGGVPYIPGSSVRGAFLSYIKAIWQDLSSPEQAFWSSLLAPDCQSWLPRKVRFESILLKNIKPFPLHAQQDWQVFDQKSNKLGIQWQVSPKPPNPNPDKFCLQVLLKDPPSGEQKKWLETRLKQMLEQQGIGRGTASGFGRLAEVFPSGTWEIQLTGMKPCVQQQVKKERRVIQSGKYRWSPQVLRANLRGYFTRLALLLLSRDNALKLTNKIFGGLGCPAKLTLTSYLVQIQKPQPGDVPRDSYTNIPAQEVHQTWVIRVNCHSEFQAFIGLLLDLASRLGGLGAGWRRPPHVLERFNGFRGSQFTVTPDNPEVSLTELINRLQEMIRQLAETYNLRLLSSPGKVAGSLVSIWQGKSDQWWDIVHGVCSTSAKPRPEWCGNSENRPSGYAVRQYEDRCLITVFDQAVEATLEKSRFQKVWC